MPGARSQAKGQRKRRHLIDAAIRVVGRKGVARATIQDVAQESGLSVGLANFYFAGKPGSGGHRADSRQDDFDFPTLKPFGPVARKQQ